MNSIGRYQIVQKLGQGGMGAVYQAFDPQIQRTVAIKIISTHMVDRPDLRERFFREARAAGQLSHRNIITIYDMGEHEGQPYITMEFVEGRDLDWHMRHGEPMSLARKLDIISEICDGLAYAHERGIIHRDVKPANIMVAPGGQVKILDFGLARVVSSDLTRSNMMFGTMEYMAPEQIRAEAVDHRADIFSVGALFYELITGRRAFQADTFAATMYRILQEVPEPIHELTTDVPPHVAAIVDRALAKSRTERYQSMPEMLRAVRLARQALETGGWTEAVTAYGSSPSPLTPPLTPPDAPTMEISRPPSPPPGTPPGTPPPGTPLPSGSAATQPSPTAPASGPAQLMGGLSRAGLGVKAAGAAVLVLLIAGGVYLATRSSGPEPPAGDVAGTGGPESVPAPPAPAPAPAPPAPVPSPGAGAGNQEQPAEPAPSNPATPAPAEEETPRETPKPPPDASERRADAAARARAESALRQMAQARNNAETSQAPDLVPDAYRRAVAQEREARNALAKGDYLQAVASAHEARASYVLADSEARRIGAAREEEARRAKARQAALDQLQTLRRAWALNRQSAERAGASTTGGSELAQAIGRVERAEQTAEQDPEGAVRVYQEAIATAQHARDEAAAAARKAAEAAKVKPPAPAPTPPAPAPGPSSAEAARRGIEDLLQRYVSALQGRDIDALKQIWPSLGGDAERAIREQFANARAISVTLGSPQITVSNGTAVVVCRRDYEVETRDGQRPRTSTRTTLQLRRNENRWLIENIRYEPLE